MVLWFLFVDAMALHAGYQIAMSLSRGEVKRWFGPNCTRVDAPAAYWAAIVQYGLVAGICLYLLWVVAPFAGQVPY